MSDAIDLNVDPDQLTIGDLEDFEEKVGKPLNEAIKHVPAFDDDGNKLFDVKGRPVMTANVPMKALRALVWIIQRKTNPAFTFDDARNVRVSQLVLGAAEESGDEGNV